MKLTPFKHLLVTRDGNIFWYVGNEFLGSENNLVSCSTEINRNLEKFWDNNFIAKRDAWDWHTSKPREKDIIYIYEITNIEQFISIFHEFEFMDYKMLLDGFTYYPYVKLVYELVDKIFEY